MLPGEALAPREERSAGLRPACECRCGDRLPMTPGVTLGSSILPFFDSHREAAPVRHAPTAWVCKSPDHAYDPPVRILVLCVALAGIHACAPREDVLTFSGSVLGAEGAIVRQQIARYQQLHPEPRIEMRPTPDAADQRRQLYVQWLNAWAPDPDILQLDVVWTPEFAAAGWILPLDERPGGHDTTDFFPATVAANTWRGRTYAVPWFVDVGMLYWRTDLSSAAPTTYDALAADARRAMAAGEVMSGFVWQGARYEGLITMFVEVLAGFGGAILDDRGEVVVDSDDGVRALTFMRDAIHREGLSPAGVLTWREEQTRFAFQNGSAAFMRNWPYAAALLRDERESAVAGRFAVAPMPREAGSPAAALGGAQLAINARSRQPDAAWQLVQYLTAPEQMIERAEVAGQFPTRRSVYDDERLADALPIEPAAARAIVDAAVPRPVTPVYAELSGILQIHVHRALTRQVDPAEALRAAATAMRAILARTGLGSDLGQTS
jgi:multiple sugar transport system substrate-binding protein